MQKKKKDKEWADKNRHWDRHPIISTWFDRPHIALIFKQSCERNWFGCDGFILRCHVWTTLCAPDFFIFFFVIWKTHVQPHLTMCPSQGWDNSVRQDSVRRDTTHSSQSPLTEMQLQLYDNMKKINVIKVVQLLNHKSFLACKGFHDYTFSLYIFFLDI